MTPDTDDRGKLLKLVRAIVRQCFPRFEFAGDFEYTVHGQTGAFVALRPTDSELELPPLPRVPFRGAPGVAAELASGTKVIVRFVNSDPARAYVAAVIGADDDGFVPTTLRVDAEATVDVGESAETVNLAGGSQFVPLENLVKARLQELYLAIKGAIPTANDGGANLKQTLLAALQLAGWNDGTGEPPSIAAAKVKAT